MECCCLFLFTAAAANLTAPPLESDPSSYHYLPHPTTFCDLSLSLQITNHTASTIEVGCVPGFSGGLPQHFVMEVYETTANNTQVLVASNWTRDSTISVWGLLPESNYIISVKAVNDRGESSPVYVGGKTEGFVQSLPRAVEESRYCTTRETPKTDKFAAFSLFSGSLSCSSLSASF